MPVAVVVLVAVAVAVADVPAVVKILRAHPLAPTVGPTVHAPIQVQTATALQRVTNLKLPSRTCSKVVPLGVSG